MASTFDNLTILASTVWTLKLRLSQEEIKGMYDFLECFIVKIAIMYYKIVEKFPEKISKFFTIFYKFFPTIFSQFF